ncbi:MAG: CarD family transcriptional regulator [Desulfobacterales bacterium]|nr:CarD family transcriptional regulator [Desulfobacteraceae bacterium]MBT7085471.1 CarD family transcriptional regulator [Desulfobacterales bacterium]MBT7696105.1 CarD family transcriptional regulator [Desulfobacterales bacterium]
MEFQKANEEVEMQFYPGDLAVYPAHGVGRIEAIESRSVGGETQDFYILKILENSMVIMIPIKSMEVVGLRNVIKKKDIGKVYEVMKGESDDKICRQPWNRRQRYYMDKIRTGSLLEVAEIFRDLVHLKERKVLSFGERKLLDNVRGLLVKELCAAKEKDEKTVISEIETFF